MINHYIQCIIANLLYQTRGINGYCKLGNFRENIIFAKSVKRHICDVKNSLQGHDLPISVNDRMISPLCEDFIYTNFHENKTLAKMSEFTVNVVNIELF